MDSSHYLGSSSKNISGSDCEGIESGWTNYIGSSFNSRYSEDGDGRQNNKQVNHKNGGGYGSDGDDGESDDSMVSDASSGPSHSEIPSSQKKGVSSSSRGVTKHTSSTTCSKKDQQILGKPRRDGARLKLEKEECGKVEAKSAASHTGSSKISKCK